MQVARNYLYAIRTGGWMPLPGGLLSDHTYSQPIEPDVYVESVPFANRRQAGQYLAEKLDLLGVVQAANNDYLWSWLGIFYLEQMAQDGTRRIGEYPEDAYLVDPDAPLGAYARMRHRLKLAFEIWTQHGEDAWFMLNEPISSLGDFTLRLASALEIFRSKGVVRLAHVLYADESTGRLKATAIGDSRRVGGVPPGSLRRLFDVVNQLSMTYDVYGMTAEQLMPLLPSEFDHFKPSPARV